MMMRPADTAACTGLATRALQAIGECSRPSPLPGPAAAFRDVEADAARLGCGSLAAAARLACLVAQQPATDADLFRHAMDVVRLVCLNELQTANGGGRAELADVLAALEERVRYSSRPQVPA